MEAFFQVLNEVPRVVSRPIDPVSARDLKRAAIINVCKLCVSLDSV